MLSRCISHCMMLVWKQDCFLNDRAPHGNLRFTHGRVSMNANDYARAWYGFDEVDGDFGLKYFNIEHDKRILYMDDGRNFDPDEMKLLGDRDKGYVVIAGNFTDESKSLSVKVDNKYLNIETQPHSFNTYVF